MCGFVLERQPMPGGINLTWRERAKQDPFPPQLEDSLSAFDRHDRRTLKSAIQAKLQACECRETRVDVIGVE
jgi:hypothetical protein